MFGVSFKRIIAWARGYTAQLNRSGGFTKMAVSRFGGVVSFSLYFLVFLLTMFGKSLAMLIFSIKNKNCLKKSFLFWAIQFEFPVYFQILFIGMRIYFCPNITN